MIATKLGGLGLPGVMAPRTVLRRLAAGAFMLLAPSLLGACANMQSFEGPSPAFDIDKDIKDLQDHYASANSIAAYYAEVKLLPGGVDTRDHRNEFITGRLTLINLKYLQYIQNFTDDKAAFDSAVDIAKLGLDLAGTLAGSAGTKAILAAISAGTTGTRLSIEKNFFNEKTAGVLVTTMNAQRKVALVPILAGTRAETADYPMAMAVVDLDNYYYAGTLSGALQAIQADAGVKDAQAQSAIDQYRSVAFKPDDATMRIKHWIWPNAKPGAGGAMVDVTTGAPAVANGANVTALDSWLTANGLDGLPIGTFLVSGDLAASRSKAASDLKMP